MKLRTYKKELGYSYALGASPTIELLQNRPDDCFKVMVSPDYTDKNGKIKYLCEKHKIAYEENRKIINILSPKENCYIAAAFRKREQAVSTDKSHVVLDSPSDMGNLGTVIRSCAGFGICDIAIIGNGADIYNPKVIRASMGAFFHVNAQYFQTIYDYMDYVGARIARLRNAGSAFPTNNNPREIYTFMLNADCSLPEITAGGNIYSLIFGNESSGLDYDAYKNIGKSVVIDHSDKIDSLNLPVAAGIALFWFNKHK